MRFLVLAVFLAFFAGCATTGNWLTSSADGKAVESAILWEAKLDETWTPVAMAKVVNDPKRFEQQGNFYKAKGDLVVFGHRATYVGLLGVELFAGPNAVLEGSPKSIAAYISQHHGAKFKSGGGNYMCDLKKDIKILIEKHPNIPGSSIIIGAYTGP